MTTRGPRLVKSNARSSAGKMPSSCPRSRLIALGREVGAVCGQDAQLRDRGVFQAQLTQVVAHASLVGDDRGVLGVGLALAAVCLGDAIDRHAGQVEQPLPPLE